MAVSGYAFRMLLARCMGMQLHCSQRVAAVPWQQSLWQAPKKKTHTSNNIIRNVSPVSHVCFAGAVADVKPEAALPGMTEYLDSLRWSSDGLVPVIVQVTICYTLG